MTVRGVDYSHTQNAPQWVVVVISVFVIVVFSLMSRLVRATEVPAWLLLLATLWAGLLYLTVLSATRLTTRVTASAVTLMWRLGWPKKAIDRASIVAASAHRNQWYERLGIRKVRRGWTWNVWGLDSVELELSCGGVFRIGTDDTAGLLRALGH